MHTTFVFSGGPAPDADGLAVVAERVRRHAAPDRVIAADGGLHLAQDLGVAVDLVVGDLDSVDPTRLDEAQAAGARIDRHPVDKDATDLELALDAALAGGTDRVVVLGADRGRLDHLVGGIATVAATRLAGVRPVAWLGATEVVPVHDRAELAGDPGDLVSLLALHGTATGVRTEGLAWPLDDEDLDPGSSRGLSNRFARPQAVVSVRSGCVVAILPGQAS
jgi:thiamine pyrophosphokinase